MKVKFFKGHAADITKLEQEINNFLIGSEDINHCRSMHSAHHTVTEGNMLSIVIYYEVRPFLAKVVPSDVSWTYVPNSTGDAKKE